MDFVSAAINSSEHYYKYLRETKGSLIEYEVTNIEYDKEYFYLTLNRNLMSLEYIQLKINANIYNNEQFKIVSFDDETKILTVSADRNYHDYLINTNYDCVKVVVDLTFLVRCVQNFYTKYGTQIKFPEHTNGISYSAYINNSDTPSSEQLNSIAGALENPLSYIWGAPGTGKTRFVLSNCILSYLKHKLNCKLLIIAPTNNAVDQTLLGLMPILSANNITTDKVFRLGTATKKFFIEYPECCENRSIEKMHAENMKKLEETENKIIHLDNLIKQYTKYLNYLNFIENINQCENDVPNMFNDIIEIHKQIENNKNLMNIQDGYLCSYKTNITKLEKEHQSVANKIDFFKKMVEKYSHGLRSILFKNKHQRFLASLECCLKREKEIADNISSYLTLVKETNKIIADANNNSVDCISEIQQIVLNINTKISFWKKFDKVSLSLSTEIIRDEQTKFYITLQLGKNAIAKKEEYYSQYANFDLDSANINLSELKIKAKKIEEEIAAKCHNASQFKMENCNILAATIDTCIRRVTPDSWFKPHHIFLDEAGYCPLIKAAALLTYDCQVTFLGDHMQLPPICEMNDDKMINENLYVGLFAQSALYIDEIFNTPKVIVQNYLNRERPKFNNLKKFELNHSFRFSEKLASVLAEYVYSSDFHGSKEHKTDIYYINAPKQDHKARVSPAEIKEIINYITNNTPENIGIIVPYKKQRELLYKYLPKDINTDICTIHASQGREWNTVLISVVDTTNKWFMNSKIFINVINTAVSRAKQKLILICDYDYWKTQDNQLIGKLVNIAEEYR